MREFDSNNHINENINDNQDINNINNYNNDSLNLDSNTP